MRGSWALAHVRFLHADAQTTALPDGFDVLVSRFGVMFFDAPELAFANLRRALRPGGRLAFVCWQALARNPWMAVPVEAVARVIPMPPPPAPDAPGPFAFADAARVGGILERAGFGEVRFENVEQELRVGPGDLDGAVSLLLELGPAGAALREAPDRQRVQAAAAEALRDGARALSDIGGCSDAVGQLDRDGPQPRGVRRRGTRTGRGWFPGMDSNHHSQVQSLLSCR